MFRKGWAAREAGIIETEKTGVFAKVRGAREAVAYAIEILCAEADIRENDDVGNRIMKRHTKVLKKLLSTEMNS
jgi:hypothetical protein